jgi:hypothetical protein
MQVIDDFHLPGTVQAPLEGLGKGQQLAMLRSPSLR